MGAATSSNNGAATLRRKNPYELPGTSRKGIDGGEHIWLKAH